MMVAAIYVIFVVVILSVFITKEDMTQEE